MYEVGLNYLHVIDSGIFLLPPHSMNNFTYVIV